MKSLHQRGRRERSSADRGFGAAPVFMVACTLCLIFNESAGDCEMRTTDQLQPFAECVCNSTRVREPSKSHA